jgi:hypothetical protein
MTRTSSTAKALGAMAGALIGAAIWTGTALAERPDDRAGMLGVGAVTSTTEAAEAPIPDAFERAIARATTDAPTRPDDRGEARGPGVLSVLPIATDAAVDDFQWSDASVGAAAALLTVACGAGLVAVRRDRRRVSVS